MNEINLKRVVLILEREIDNLREIIKQLEKQEE